MEYYAGFDVSMNETHICGICRNSFFLARGYGLR
jgi:hypothetical protein